MSADNGVYILRTFASPIKDDNYYKSQHEKYEYRVAPCQAIEDVDYSDLYMPLLFGNSKVFDNFEDALQEAQTIHDSITRNDGFTEYGICEIEKNTLFPNMTQKAAVKALDIYVGAKPLDYKE